jgi:Fic/DOC family
VLWRLNNIHPFINGNGRTARAACYFVLCLKAGGWLPGETILPELIKRDRDEYCQHLQVAHESFAQTGDPNLGPLHGLVTRLLDEQFATVPDLQAAQPQPAVMTAAAESASTVRAWRAKTDEVQLRFTLKKQADDRFCVWDNVADELAKFGETTFVDLEYEKAWDEAERLNRDIPLPW